LVHRCSNHRFAILFELHVSLSFIGPIPAELGQLSNVSDLNLSDNLLTGVVQIGAIRIVIWISLIFLHFATGTIPESLGNMGALIELRLTNNQLEGQVFVCFRLVTRTASAPL
jgi:hypothetical protein